MDDAFDVRVAGRLQYVEGSFDVGAHIRSGCVVRVRYTDERSEVKDGVYGVQRVRNAITIRDVAGDDFKMLLQFGLIEPTPRPVSAIMNESPNLRAGFDKCLDEMASDEAPGSGYKDALSFQ